MPEDDVALVEPREEKKEEAAGDVDAFNKIQLDAHNQHRAAHGAPKVVWDADLAKQA